jgi:hypothetical protein
VHQVGPLLADEEVVAVPAVEPVGALAARQLVLAVLADRQVGAPP